MLLIGLFLAALPGRAIDTISLRGITISVEIADTQDERTQGLSGRKELLKNNGMLFVFDHPDRYSFWMKEMRFPIDIIWLDENFSVIMIAESIPPESFPKSFTPDAPALYVLEVPAGFSEENHLVEGDRLLLHQLGSFASKLWNK